MAEEKDGLNVDLLKSLVKSSETNRKQLDTSLNPGGDKTYNLDFKTYNEKFGPEEFQLGKASEFDFRNKLTNQLAQEEYQAQKDKADNQSIWSEAANGIMQTGANFLFGIPKYIGYLLDLEASYNYLVGNDADWNNWLSDEATAWQESTKEAFPVYTNSAPDRSALDKATEWFWGTLLPQIGDSAALPIPALTAVKAANVGLRTLNTASKVGLAVSPKAKNLLNGLGTAFVSRQIENTAEADQVQKEEYAKLIAKGVSEEDARHLASEAAAFTYRANWGMLLQDIFEYKAMLRGFDTSKAINSAKVARAAGTSTTAARLTRGLEVGKQMLGEAGEEAYQFIVAEEGKHYADVKAGIKKDNNFLERFGEYLQDGELWESALLGGLSAGVTQTLSQPAKERLYKLMDKNYQTEKDVRTNEIRERGENIGRHISALNQATQMNDKGAYEIAKTNMAVDVAINAAKAGNLDLAINQIESFKNSTPEQKEKLGITPEFIQNIPELVNDLRDIGNAYAKTATRYSPETVVPIVQRETMIKKFNKQIPETRTNIQKLESQLPRLDELSIVGRQVFDLTATNLSLQKVANYYNSLLSGSSISDEDRKTYTDKLAKVNEVLENTNNVLKDVKNAPEYKGSQDESILKVLDTSLINDYTTEKKKLKLLEDYTSKFTDELATLTSPQGQTDFKTKLAEAYKIKQNEAVKNETLKAKAETQKAEQAKHEASKQNIKAEKVAEPKQPKEPDYEILGSDDTLEGQVDQEKFTVTEGMQSLSDIPTDSEESYEVQDDELAKQNLAFMQEQIERAANNTSKEIATNNVERIPNKEDKQKMKEEMGTKSPLSFAYKSANNSEASEADRSEENKARTEFFEDPTILNNKTIKEYDLEFEVDLNFIRNNNKYINYLDKENKLRKDLTPEEIGKLPVRINIMRDGSPVVYKGFPMFSYVKDSNNKNFDSSIKEVAAKEIIALKTAVYQSDKTLSSKIVNKKGGFYKNAEFEEGERPRNNISVVLNQDAKDIILAVSDGNIYLAGPNNQPVNQLRGWVVPEREKSSNAGAVFAVAYDCNDKPTPMRVFTDLLSKSEAEVVYRCYEALMTRHKKFTDTISPELSTYIGDHEDGKVSGIKTFIDLKNATYSDIINTFAYQTDSDILDSENPLYLKAGILVINNQRFKPEDFVANPDKIKRALQNKIRQINKNRLNTAAYNEYLINNKVVHTNVEPNELETNTIFVQPLIEYEFPTSQISSASLKEKIANIERRRQEELLIPQNLNKLPDYLAEGIKQAVERLSVDKRYKIVKEAIAGKTAQQIVSELNLINDGRRDTEIVRQVRAYYGIPSQDTEGYTEWKNYIDKINAKYDAELAALEKSSEEKINNIVAENVLPEDNQKELDEDIKKTLKNSNISDKDKETFEGLFLRVSNIGEFKPIDLKSELEWYQSVLPQVPIEVIQELISVSNKGDKAYGRFMDGMITISEQAAKGTVYHEAFHAVQELLLTPEENKAIMEEASGLYNTTDVRKLKEELAEGFREYIEFTRAPNAISRLYNRLANLISWIFGKKLTVARLYANINHGYYKGNMPLPKTVEESSDPLYMRQIPGFTQQELESTVDLLAYVMFKSKKNPDIKDVRGLNADMGRKYILAQLEKAVTENNLELAKAYQKVINNFTKEDGLQVDYESPIYKALVERLNSLGVVTKFKTNEIITDEQEETDQSEKESGAIDIKPAYLQSDRDSATASTKLLIALTPSVRSVELNDTKNIYKYNLDPIYGTPIFEDFDNLFNMIKDTMTNIVPYYDENGKYIGAFDVMIDTLNKNSLYYPSLAHIAETLKNSDQLTKAQFYFTMAGTKNVYSSSFVEYEEDGAYVVKIGNPDVQGKEQTLRNEWSEIFKAKLTKIDKDKIVIDKDKLDRLLTKFHLIKAQVKSMKGTSVSDEMMNDILDLLKDTGIVMSNNGLLRAIDFAEGDNRVEKLQNIFFSKGLTYLYENSIPAYAKSKINDDSRIPLQNESSVKYLATHEGFLTAKYGSNVVLMAEGNQYASYSKHNLITRTVAEWKQNPSSLLELIDGSTLYTTNSLWLNEMTTKDREGNRIIDQTKLDNFQPVYYGHYKEENSGDDGTSLSDLKEPDELSDRINRILKGVFIGLAKADKSTDIHFTGPRLRNSGIIRSGDNLELSSTSEVTNVMLNYLLDELYRVKGTIDDESKLAPEKQVIYYHYKDKPGDGKGNGRRIYLMDALSYDKEGKNLGLYHTEGSMAGYPIAQSIEDLKANKPLIDFLNKSFTDLVKKEAQYWIENNIVILDEGKIKNNSIDINTFNKYFSKTKNAGQAMYEMIGDYLLNGIIGSVETTKLFTGDPAAYKAKGGDIFEDFQKRIPAIIAAGNLSYWEEGMPLTYKSATVGNIDKIKSLYTDPEHIKLYAQMLETNAKNRGQKVKDIKAYIKEAEETLNHYNEINQTDAQGWITLDAYRDRMRSWGKWNDYHQKTYDAIKAFEKDPSEQNRKKALTLSFQHKLGLQPLKTVHVELLRMNGNKRIMQYNKQSEALLNPLFTMGTQLDILRQQMIKQKVDHVIVLDGKKVGGSGITDIANPQTGNIYEDFKLEPVELQYSGLMLQQDLPYKDWHDTLLGSQAKKNVLANIQLDQPYIIDGKEITGAELAQMLFDVESAVSDKGKEQILNELGYNPVNNTIETAKIREMLLNSFKDKPTVYNAIEALESGLPIEAMVNYRKKMQNQVLAAINKATVKVKTFGGSFIQMSNFGFSELTEEQKNAIIYLNDGGRDTLKPPTAYIAEDGKMKIKPGQVFLPYNVIKEIPGYEKMSSDELKAHIDPRLLKGFGYRIPNQDIPSNDIIEIAGILPPSAGDTIIAYTEITTKTGSDFDIDKMFVSFPAYEVKDGKLTYIEFNPNQALMEQSKEALDNRRLQIYESIILDPKTYPSLIKGVDSTWLKNDLKALFPKPTLSQLEWFSPSNQMKTKREFQGGKFGVGQTANHVTDHPLAQLAKLYLVDYSFDAGNIIDGQTSFAGVLGQDITEGKQLYEGGIISENTSAFLNAYVDIAKDPYVARGNHNTMTAPIVFMLLRAGVNRYWINRFIAQPIIVDYVNYTFKTEGVTSPEKFIDGRKKNAEDYTLEKYGISRSAEARKITAKNLSINQLEDIIKANQNNESVDPALQHSILELFKEYVIKAKAFNNQVTSSKQDTLGAGSTLIESRVMQNKKQAVEDSNIIGNFDRKFDNTMLGTYYKNSVELVLDLFSDTFFSETQGFINTTNLVLNNLGRNGLFDADLGAAINDDLYAYIMNHQAAGFQRPFEEIYKMFYEKNNMVNRLLKFKYHTDTAINSRPLIKYLQYFTEYKGPSIVGVSRSKSLQIPEQNELYRDWRAMLTDPNPELRKFAEDLIPYSYYTSGFKNNLYSFYDLIPSDWIKDRGMSDFINNMIKEYNEPDTIFPEFVKQFFKNNWSNNKIVPNISLKHAIPYGNKVPKEIGFYLPDDAGYSIGYNEDELPEMNRYLKTKGMWLKEFQNGMYDYKLDEYGKRIWVKPKLYQLAGYKTITVKDKGEIRVGVYHQTNPLGYSKRGKAIREFYIGSERPNSVVLENRLKLDDKFMQMITDQIKGIETGIKPVDFDRTKKFTKSDLNQDDDFDSLDKICIIE